MDYIILLFSCIAEYLIFSDFFDAFLTIRPNFQPLRNRLLIAIPFIGIYFCINVEDNIPRLGRCRDGGEHE